MGIRKRIVIGGLVVIVVAAGAGLAWWTLRPEGPEAVDLEAAVARVEAPAPSVAAPDDGDQETDVSLEGSVDRGATTSVATTVSVVTSSTDVSLEGSVDGGATTSVATTVSVVTSTTEAPDEAPSTEVGSSTETTLANPVADSLIGIWTLVTSEGADALVPEPAVSFAGYRVVEVLAGGVDESTAVGRTAKVTGSLELSHSALVAATVEVEMATLRTDDSHRDSHMRQALNTKEFPLAVFTLVEPLELPVGISWGQPFSGSAHGDLTIKGVTNRTVFDLQARIVGETIVVVGSSEVVFSDYGVTEPTSVAVISVEDHGIMEFQLYFTR